jgi:hypothetical protein
VSGGCGRTKHSRSLQKRLTRLPGGDSCYNAPMAVEPCFRDVPAAVGLSFRSVPADDGSPDRETRP